MTRTNNTLRVTFSANLDSGQAYITDKSREALSEVIEQGWLWAKDVLTEWREEIDQSLEYAEASFLGWFDAHSPDAVIPKDSRQLAFRLWSGGVWPNLFNASDYVALSGARLDGADIEGISQSDDFFDDMKAHAMAEASASVKAMRDSGVRYTHGNCPSASDLTMFYVLRELVGIGDEPTQVTYANEVEQMEPAGR